MKNLRKSKILLLLHMPPPATGATVMGELTLKAFTEDAQYSVRRINTTLTSSLNSRNWLLKPVVSGIDIGLRLIKEMICHRPDIVYMTPPHGGLLWYYYAILVTSVNIMGRRVILHHHNKGEKINKSNILKRTIYKRNTSIILSSRLTGYYPQTGRTHILANGLDIDRFDGQCDSRQFRNEDDGSIKLLFLSNLIVSKGVLILLDSLGILLDREINVRCVIVGSEAEFSKLTLHDEIRKRGLDKIVEYPGPIYGPDKGRIFSESDIFIFPSFYPLECYPLVLIEASAHGLPIIAFSNGAVEDIVINDFNGYVVPPSAEDIADKVAFLTENRSTLKSMSEASLTLYSENNTSDTYKRNLKGIIEEYSKPMNT